jgi:hypothetical protein
MTLVLIMTCEEHPVLHAWCDKCKVFHATHYCERCRKYHEFHPTWKETEEMVIQQMANEITKEIDEKVVQYIIEKALNS